MKYLDQKPIVDHDPREFTRPPYMSPLRRIVMAATGLLSMVGALLMLAAWGGGGKGFLLLGGLFCLIWGAIFVLTAAFPKSDI